MKSDKDMSDSPAQDTQEMARALLKVESISCPRWKQHKKATQVGSEALCRIWAMPGFAGHEVKMWMYSKWEETIGESLGML